MMPLDSSGGLERISQGRDYTFSFHYFDGTASHSGPGMGEDKGVADSLIFQVHPINAPGGVGDLGLRLNFIDNTDDIGDGNEHWAVYGPECSGDKIMWHGDYTPGESDNWKIQLAPASYTKSGHTRVYRNDTLVLEYSGANMCNPSVDGGDPWWNMGPYKWRWELPDGGGSTMTEVDATISNMVETSP